jgi:flagellar biosynthesis anti-sigma factor FlgM
MKIYGNNEPVSRLNELQGRHPVSSKKNVTQDLQTKSVEISNIASELGGFLRAELNNVPDIRTDKAKRVDELKGMINGGTYKVDDEKLADVLSNFLK